MANAILIHGLGGYPEENWFPWLKAELEKVDVNVFVPAFPHTNKPRLDEWFSEFSKYRKLINSDTILVGHSLGCAFLLNFLELWNLPVKSVFLVAGFTGLLDNSEVNSLVREFSDREFGWEHIREKSGMFYVLHSDNDPYVSLSKAMQLALNLGVEVTLVRNAGHFNERSNYHRFPKLLAMIKKEL